MTRRCRATRMTATRSLLSSMPTGKLTGCAIERAFVDKGYRSHGTANPHRVFVPGQKCGLFGIIKRELRRRSAIEAVIGRMKTDGHLGRCYLKGSEGDAANVIVTAVGYNLRLILAWLSSLLRLIALTICRALTVTRSIGLLNGRRLRAHRQNPYNFRQAAPADRVAGRIKQWRRGPSLSSAPRA
jgi:hypothetical protein